MPLDIPIPRTIFSVSQITRTISRIIEQQPQLQNVWVKGQISNLSQPASGHIYFTLKDENSTIRSVAFRSTVSRFQYLPSDGEEVLVQGKINIYAASSNYQIVVNKIEPLGIGALQRAFEELKQRLADEGLFDAEHKKPLPEFPKKIGVITSETGAAIQDIQEQLRNRYPLAELFLYPTLVQGEYASAQIANAIGVMNNRTDVDVLIVGRGGGSLEDLWAFNEEKVARAIFASRIPVVSAVGHETDFTISDMVADHRSPTPTAAVEHVVPDQQELLFQLNAMEERICSLVFRRISTLHDEINLLKERLSPTKRIDSINQLSQTLDGLEMSYSKAVSERMTSKRDQLESFTAQLNGLSPLATLTRGYSISRTSTGKIITSNEQVNVGDKLDVTLSDGRLLCTVDEQVE